MERPAVQTGCEDCPVRDDAICSVLDDSDRRHLVRIGVHRDFERGQTIFAAGDDSIACATLISGALKLSKHDAEGVERIVALVHPAGFLGELFAPNRELDVTALTTSRLCIVPRKDFEALIADRPLLAQAMLRRTLDALGESRALVDLIGRRDARSRVAGLLLEFARSAAVEPCGQAAQFELPLTRGEMASLLGLTIETVSRQLSKLEADQVISRSGSKGMTILDARTLEELAG
jgi:CRP/FNR family transcriptional regulator, anaerobic regulatory protein